MKKALQKLRAAMVRWRALPNPTPTPDDGFFDRPKFYLREVKP